MLKAKGLTLGVNPLATLYHHKTSTTSQIASLTQKLHASINSKGSSLNYQTIDS